jgi:chromosomal replication initiation ATPase DnaA
MAQLRTLERRLALRREMGQTPIGVGRAAVRQAIDPAVAAVFDVEIADLRAATRSSPRAAFARQVAMYLAHVVCGLSLTAVGALFQRDRTTVAHACGVIEDRRDDPDLDARIEHLEHAVASLIDALGFRCGPRQ